MSKPLLIKNTRSLLVWLPLVLLASCLLFYIVLRMHAHHMQEKQLLLKQDNVWTSFSQNPDNFPMQMQGEYDLTEVSSTPSIEDEPIDTSVYFAKRQQTLPFQAMSGYHELSGKTYLLTTYVSSREIRHLIIKVFLTEAMILLLLLLTVIIVNKRNSRLLWQPFLSSMQKVKGYSITDNQNIDLPVSTGTTEFDELNKEITYLIKNVNQAYLQQKQFVENASHEMQTPLAIIRSKLELLINQRELTEQTAILLGDITEANDRLSQMNKTLLLLAKIENNQFPEMEEINVGNLLQRLLRNYQDHYENDFPKLVQDVQSNVMVKANYSLIEILLSNILKNAIEHNQKDGVIEIGLSGLKLSVKNTGTQPETETENFFERFKKGAHHAKTTGLGLSLVRQICLLYQYSIEYIFQDGWHEIIVKFR